MDLNLTEYQKNATRTFVRKENQLADIQHLAYGIFTEFGEIIDILKKTFAYGKDLDVNHLGEEIGDMFWYIANWFTLAEQDFTIDASEVTFLSEELGSKEEAQKRIIENLNPFLLCSHFVEYGPGTFVTVGLDIVDAFDLNIDEILNTNIEKLKVRYPEQFDADKAINRDLDSEKQVLNKV